MERYVDGHRRCGGGRKKIFPVLRAGRRLWVILAVFTAVAMWVPAGVQAAPPGWAKGRILVAPRAGLSDAEFDKILSKRGARSREKIGRLKVHVVHVPEKAEAAVARALSHNPHIEFAELDRLMGLQMTPDDPRYSSAWHLPRIDAPPAWDVALGDNIVVAILDTGVDGSHPDLYAQMVPGWNAAGSNYDTSDVHGHGTKVAGTTAAVSNNATGVASIAWNALIMPVRITDRTDGYAYSSDIARGLDWATDNGALVANISYNVSNSSTVSSAAQRMRNNGGVVVVAAGNDGSDPGFSDNPYIISVAATASNDVRTSWSNFGDYVDVAAPGSGIWTTSRGGNYGSVSGTSFASPLTAGVVALIMSANPLLTPAEVELILEDSADDLGSPGWDPYYGSGRINAFGAVVAASQSNDVDGQPPSVVIASPAAGATVSVMVPVSVSASDNVLVTRVELYSDSVMVGVDQTAPFNFSWDSTAENEGPNSLTAYAYDDAGNQGDSIPVNVVVDNVPNPTPTPEPDPTPAPEPTPTPAPDPTPTPDSTPEPDPGKNAKGGGKGNGKALGKGGGKKK